MLPDSRQTSTLNQIYVEMAALENAALVDVDPKFTSYDYPPTDNPPYPFMFRWPPKWSVEDRAMGSGSNKPFHWEISVVLLIGLSSNDVGSLTALVEPFIVPFYELYMAHRSINRTVNNITFGHGFMGDILFNEVKHFGAEFLVLPDQRRPFFSSL